MQGLNSSVIRRDPRRRMPLFLAFCWCAGLLGGIAVYCTEAPALNILIDKLLCDPERSGMLLFVCLAPYLFSAAAVIMSAPGTLLLICFVKAFLFGFLSAGVQFCYGTAGWFFRFLILFEDIAAAPWLYLLWLRSLDSNKRAGRRTMLLLFTFCMIVACWYADLSIISPYLACLIDF